MKSSEYNDPMSPVEGFKDSNQSKINAKSSKCRYAASSSMRKCDQGQLLRQIVVLVNSVKFSKDPVM